MLSRFIRFGGIFTFGISKSINNVVSSQFYLPKVVETDYAHQHLKVHFSGYPKSMDEWRDVTKEEEQMCLLDERLIPSKYRLEERAGKFGDKLCQK